MTMRRQGLSKVNEATPLIPGYQWPLHILSCQNSQNISRYCHTFWRQEPLVSP